MLSAARSGDEGAHSLRSVFSGELREIRGGVDRVAALVGEALDRMLTVLSTADALVAGIALEADDEIDASVVALTERCYDLLRRQAPVASDLRFVVSALRVLEELERMADLALRVVKLSPELHPGSRVHATLEGMAASARSLYSAAARAWTRQDLELACSLGVKDRAMDSHYAELLSQLLALEGPGATALAVPAVLVGRALDRIADHSVIVGERVSYVLTADSSHLASELR